MERLQPLRALADEAGFKTITSLAEASGVDRRVISELWTGGALDARLRNALRCVPEIAAPLGCSTPQLYAFLFGDEKRSDPMMYVSLEEAGKARGISSATLLDWIRGGFLLSIRDGGEVKVTLTGVDQAADEARRRRANASRHVRFVDRKKLAYEELETTERDKVNGAIQFAAVRLTEKNAGIHVHYFKLAVAALRRRWPRPDFCAGFSVGTAPSEALGSSRHDRSRPGQ